MLRDDIETIATAAGAEQFIYDEPNKANVLADTINSGEVIAIMDEVNTINQNVRNNGVDEVAVIRIAFVKQVDINDYADNNAILMEELRIITNKFLIELTKSEYFGRNISSRTSKYLENMTDANLIGWQMSINLPIIEGYSIC